RPGVGLHHRGEPDDRWRILGLTAGRWSFVGWRRAKRNPSYESAESGWQRAILTLQKADQPVPQRLIRILPPPGLEVVQHVAGVSRSGDHAGHRRVAEAEFQQELRPARAAVLAGPCR